MLQIGNVIEGHELLASGEPRPFSVLFRVRRLGDGSEHLLEALSDAGLAVPEGAARFASTAQARLALAQHPHLFSVSAAFESEGRLCVVSESASGESLRAFLERTSAPLPVALIRELFLQLLDGLSHAHLAGLLHGAIRPAAIHLEPRQAGLVARLDGFGLPLPRTAAMSPEQLRGEPATAQSDLFALGAVLYQAATGKPPFGTTDAEVRLRILAGRYEAPETFAPTLPPELAQAIQRALRPAPAERFQSAAEFCAALSTLPAARLPKAPPADRKRGLDAARAAGAVAAAAGAAAANPDPAPRREPPRPTAAAPGEVPRCKAHPSEAAGWVCNWCDSQLCPDCAGLRKAGFSEIIVCLPCGGPARVLIRERSQKPYLARMSDISRWVASGPVLGSLVAMGLFTGALGYLGWLASLVATGFTWAWFFALIRTSSIDSRELMPEFRDAGSDIVLPLLRGLVAFLPVWLPLAIAPFTDGVEQVALVAGALLVGAPAAPMALMIAATGGGTLPMLNPVLIVGYAARLGTDYLVAAATTFALVLLWMAMPFVSAMVAGAIPVPFLPTLAMRCLTLVVPMVLARTLGLLIFVRGADLGYGLRRDYEVEVLPGVKPRGVVQEKEAPGADAQAHYSVAPIELEEPVGMDTSAPGAAEAAASIAAALSRKDVAAALTEYRGRPQRSLPPRLHFDVARALAATGNFPQALQAFTAAATLVEGDPIAPRALVLMARLHAERLDDAVSAERIYRDVVARFPGSEDAKFAAARLAPPQP